MRSRWVSSALAVFQQMCPERSELDGAWPARTVEDPVADDPLE